MAGVGEKEVAFDVALEGDAEHGGGYVQADPCVRSCRDAIAVVAAAAAAAAAGIIMVVVGIAVGGIVVAGRVAFVAVVLVVIFVCGSVVIWACSC